MARRKQEWAKRVKKERFRRRYLSRMQATRLLQVDSMNFRRLCILKGIYPRAMAGARSKQKASGTDKQYYLTKEVKWLIHDPIVAKIAAFRGWQKKVRKAKAQHDFAQLESLERSGKRPQYALSTTIKERYPTFAEALKDVDDAMTNISLYSFLTPEVESSSTIEFHHALPTGLHEKAKEAVDNFMAFVARSHALSRAFISVKGFYYEAIINGQRILWLMPHEYASKFPSGVQQYILITFLEFQVELMRFVLFKLNNDFNRAIAERERQIEEGINEHAVDFEQGKQTADSEGKPQRAATKAVSAQALRDLLTADQPLISKLFESFVFFVSREVPLKHVKFIIEACGGRVVQDFGPTVTHYVVDRPTLLPPHKPEPNVEYVQPQYLWDCLNSRMVLPVHGYRINETLPPHVSPFTVSITGTAADNAAVEDVRKRHPKIVSYVPDRVHEIRKFKDPNYSKLDPKGLVDDEGSDVSEDDRMRLGVEGGFEDDIPMSGEEIQQAKQKPKWVDEQVLEHAKRSKLSEIKVQKQRELNLMNQPTPDVAAAHRAEKVKHQVEQRQSETRDQRVKRKLRDALKQHAASKKMKLQVARSKARRYYNMVNSNVRGAEKRERILASKAKMLQKGKAEVTSDGKTYRTGHELSREKKQAAAAGGKDQPARGKKPAKKAAAPYAKLPKWVR